MYVRIIRDFPAKSCIVWISNIVTPVLLVVRHKHHKRTKKQARYGDGERDSGNCGVERISTFFDVYITIGNSSSLCLLQ